MRKIFALLFVVILTMVCLAACSAQGGTSPDNVEVKMTAYDDQGRLIIILTNGKAIGPIDISQNANVDVQKTEFDTQGRLIVTLTDGTVLSPITLPTASTHMHMVNVWCTIIDASCKTIGLEVGECNVCKEPQARYIPVGEHEWADATCLRPKTCKICETTEGDPGDHNFVNGACTYCFRAEVTPDVPVVTIRFVHTMGAQLQKVLDKYIAEFNELYPTIHVEHENGGGYDDVRNTIKTQINVGAQPNIAFCYPDHVAVYNMAGAVQPLNEYINSSTIITRADGTTEIVGLTQEQIDAFIDGFYNEGFAFGDGTQMYTLPFSKSTELLYYNVEFFEKHNLKVPTTWAEMEEVCAKIKEIDPTSIPLGYDSGANLFITMCEQLGSPYTSATGGHFLFDNQTNKDFVKMFREWYQKGYMTTKALNGDTYTSNLFVTTYPDDIKSYMCIASSGGAQHHRPAVDINGVYPFTVGIAPIPQANPDAPKAISQGPSVTILKSRSQEENFASWLFVKFLVTNVDFQAEYSMTSGYMPVLESEVMNQNENFARYLKNGDKGNNYITALALKVAMEASGYYFVPPAFNGSSTARDQAEAIISACLPFQGDAAAVDRKIDQVFQDAIDECEYQS